MKHVRAPTPETFGAQLRALRESRGMPLSTFARQIGLTHPYVSQIEHNHRYPFSLQRLRSTRTLLHLTDAEFSTLVYTAAQDYVLAVHADDFTKPRDALHLVALLAAYDQRIPRDFFLRTTTWIEEHCSPSQGDRR